MSAARTSAQLAAAPRNLGEAQRVRRMRAGLRAELRRVPARERPALLADAVEELPGWLAGARVPGVLEWAWEGRVVACREAERLYALTGARREHALGELTVRQRAVLVAGLRALT